MTTSGGSFTITVMLPLEETTGLPTYQVGELVQGAANPVGDRTVYHWKAKLTPRVTFTNAHPISPDSSVTYDWIGTSSGPKVSKTSRSVIFYPDYHAELWGGTHTQWSTYGSAQKVFCTIGRLSPEIYYYCQCNVRVEYNGQDPNDLSNIRTRKKDSFSYEIFYRAPYSTGWTWNYISTTLPGDECSWDVEDYSLIFQSIARKAVEAHKRVASRIPNPPPWTLVYKGSIRSFAINDIATALPPDAKRLVKKHMLPDVPHHGVFCALAQKAAENIQYVDINSVAFIKELRDQLGEIKALLDLIKAPLNPKKWASFYLSCQYGTRLTIADVLELIQGIQLAARQNPLGKKGAFNTCRARETFSLATPGVLYDSITYNYKICYRPYDKGIMSFIDRLSKWDLLPSLGNLWDLVPYSFVVDWFIDVGGMLESCDAACKLISLPVCGTSASFKRSYRITGLSLAGAQWDSEFTVYSRNAEREVILPHPSLSFPGNAQNNILQLSAILVQKI